MALDLDDGVVSVTGTIVEHFFKVTITNPAPHAVDVAVCAVRGAQLILILGDRRGVRLFIALSSAILSTTKLTGPGRERALFNLPEVLVGGVAGVLFFMMTTAMKARMTTPPTVQNTASRMLLVCMMESGVVAE